jgi:hypothetical protein
MKMIASLLVAVAAFSSACGGAVRPSGGGPDASDRIAEIYAAVVSQLVTRDHTFEPGTSPFDRVFILDRIVDNAGNPDVPDGKRRPFPDGVPAELARRLDPLVPIEFVPDLESVLTGTGLTRHVKDNGVLITLGPISGNDERVTVPNSLYFALLGAQWLTYELEPVDGHWRVKGRVGPMAIS